MLHDFPLNLISFEKHPLILLTWIALFLFILYLSIVFSVIFWSNSTITLNTDEHYWLLFTQISHPSQFSFTYFVSYYPGCALHHVWSLSNSSFHFCSLYFCFVLTSIKTSTCTEDFNRHILDPDLTPEQLEQLHHDALELYHTYMVPSALDHIKFPTHIVAHIRESKKCSFVPGTSDFSSYFFLSPFLPLFYSLVFLL